MNISIFIFVLLLLQGACLYAGKRAAKSLKDQTDYFLAGKSVKFFPLLMTFVATQVGGGLILGASDEAYKYGWFVLLYPLGACLGFLLLASGIGRKLAQFQVSTVAQLFEVVYNSQSLKKLASLLSIISLFMILVAQVVASQKFMNSLGFNQNWIFILFWALIIIYTVIGGLKAVVSIDIIQASYFIIIFLIGFGFVLYAEHVPFYEVIAQGFNEESFEYESQKLTGWLFMPLLFMVIEQDMAQRCFAARSPKVVTKAAMWSAIIMLVICVIPIYFGILANTLDIAIPKGSSVFMTVSQMITTPTLSALIGCAVLMAIISTAISLINAVSSNLNEDFNLSFLSHGEQGVSRSRFITALIGILAVAFSFYFENIVDLLILSYELSVYCLFVPVFIALFYPQGHKISAIMAIIFGAVGFILFNYYHFWLPKEIASVLLSALGFGLGEILVSRKRTA